MIISASRRTDIPALYPEWFMNRVQEGYCLVPNPVFKSTLTKISLLAEDVDLFVFWSKNPEPLMPYLSALDSMGYRYYFQFTLNDYQTEFEPKIPALSKRVETFKKLSSAIGREKVIWRYDPVILSNITPVEYHMEKFAKLCCELAGYTERCIISIVDMYKKTARRFAELEDVGIRCEAEPLENPELGKLIKFMIETAAGSKISLCSCAEEPKVIRYGVMPGKCIDDKLIKRIFDIDVPDQKHKAQRQLCRCVVSRDIGTNNSCIHGCAYCYSTVSAKVGSEKHKMHDPKSPLLIGCPDPNAKIFETVKAIKRAKPTQFFTD